MNSIPLPPNPPEPHLDGSGLTIGLVVSRYHWEITGAMLHLAQEELLRLNVAREHIHIVYTPGAYELATAAQAMLRSENYDALICFGCVMRGETRHDVVVTDAAAQGIQRVALDAHVPVIFGVMCAENQHQAEARAHRGAECAHDAIEMAQTIRSLNKAQKR